LFASIWIFTLGLPWQKGAEFFMKHLFDGDAASNTLSWRWVAGIQTKGKNYLAQSWNISKFTNNKYKNVKLNETALPIMDKREYKISPIQISKNENSNQDTFVVKTKKFKGGIDRLLRSVRILNTEAVERVEINKGKLLDFKVINKNFKRTITVGAALAGTILFGPELLKPRLMGGIALLETNQISTFSNSTTRGINKSIKSSVCLLSPSEINKEAIIPSAEISIDKPLLFSLSKLKEISILKNGQEVWNSTLKTTNLISKPLNWPIAPIRPNDNYVVALTPGEDASKEPTYLELKQKINPLFEIDSLEKKLGKNKKLWEKEISKNLKDNQDLALSLLYSENIPDSKRFNEVREKIRESVKCP